MADPLHVGLLWHSVNSGNLGVGALTVANLALARAAAGRVGRDIRFSIIGPHDRGPTYLAGDDIVAMLRTDRRTILTSPAYWRHLATLDCLLDIGGGDSFTDIYGAKRFAWLWITRMMAIARRRPLLLSPQTIGPFHHPAFRWLAATAMRRMDGVVTRDPLSTAAARALAPDVPLVEAIDVAFALPYAPAPRQGGPLRVGINISGLLFNGGYRSGNAFGLGYDYATVMRSLVATLSQQSDIRVELICHVNAPDLPADDDGRIADAMARAYPGVVRVPDFASPGAAKSYISGLDLLVAGRMHACIAAFSAGVPVIPIAYSRKFAGLFSGALGYHHIVTPDVGANPEALGRLLGLVSRRNELAHDVAAGQVNVARRLAAYESVLERLFMHGPSHSQQAAATAGNHG